MSKKRLFLFIIVLAEVVVGGGLLLLAYNYFHRSQIEAQTSQVSVINKDTVVIPEDVSKKLKYYFEFTPNHVKREQPEWLPEEAVYTYNSEGFNERFEYEVEKQTGTFRIITLGDSFTFGHFVSTEKNWTELLEDKLTQGDRICGIDKFEVINLGMPGYDVEYSVEHYKNRGAKYQPDLVIWFESGSGFSRLNELTQPVIAECQKEQKLNPDRIETATSYQECWFKAQKVISNTRTQTEIETFITTQLGRLFAELPPEKIRFFMFETSAMNDEQKNGLATWRRTFPAVSFLPIIPNISSRREVLADNHPSPQGHRTIATTIYDHLKSDLLKDCTP